MAGRGRARATWVREGRAAGGAGRGGPACPLPRAARVPPTAPALLPARPEGEAARRPESARHGGRLLLPLQVDLLLLQGGGGEGRVEVSVAVAVVVGALLIVVGVGEGENCPLEVLQALLG